MSEAPPLALDARLSIVVGQGESAFRVSAELRLERGVLLLFGPSGSGKSLTLKGLAGLVDIERGHVLLGGETLLDTSRRLNVPPHVRRVGYVPQDAALFPFASVRDNVAFGLPKRERRGDEPLAMMKKLGIASLANARPSSLSGGERQRVALARALIVSPRLLLLDEPLSSLDDEARASLQKEVKRVGEEDGVPVVLVTHSRDEAEAFGGQTVRFERTAMVGKGS